MMTVFALLMAPSGLFDAAASNYGRVPEDVESVLRGACPIVGSYGALDWTERDHAERLERAVTNLHVPHDVKLYPNASHSFVNRHQGMMRILGRVTDFGLRGIGGRRLASSAGYVSRTLQ